MEPKLPTPELQLTPERRWVVLPHSEQVMNAYRDAYARWRSEKGDRRNEPPPIVENHHLDEICRKRNRLMAYFDEIGITDLDAWRIGSVDRHQHKLFQEAVFAYPGFMQTDGKERAILCDVLTKLAIEKAKAALVDLVERGGISRSEIHFLPPLEPGCIYHSKMYLVRNDNTAMYLKMQGKTLVHIAEYGDVHIQDTVDA